MNAETLFILLATQLLLLTDFDLFSLVRVNLILILCKTIDSFIEVERWNSDAAETNFNDSFVIDASLSAS